MTGQEWVDLTVDYLLSKKDPSYSAGLDAEQLRGRIEDEINSMTRIEYLRVLGDSEDIKLFHDKQKLARGETLTKTYIVTLPDDEQSK